MSISHSNCKAEKDKEVMLREMAVLTRDVTADLRKLSGNRMHELFADTNQLDADLVRAARHYPAGSSILQRHHGGTNIRMRIVSWAVTPDMEGNMGVYVNISGHHMSLHQFEEYLQRGVLTIEQ